MTARRSAMTRGLRFHRQQPRTWWQIEEKDTPHSSPRRIRLEWPTQPERIARTSVLDIFFHTVATPSFLFSFQFLRESYSFTLGSSGRGLSYANPPVCRDRFRHVPVVTEREREKTTRSNSGKEMSSVSRWLTLQRRGLDKNKKKMRESARRNCGRELGNNGETGN